MRPLEVYPRSQQASKRCAPRSNRAGKSPALARTYPYRFDELSRGVAADVGIVPQRAERTARILRFEVESRSSGAARLPNLKGEP